MLVITATNVYFQSVHLTLSKRNVMLKVCLVLSETDKRELGQVLVRWLWYCMFHGSSEIKCLVSTLL